jgi:NhaP-type Na+/H+ or K+/H+ antiporter
MSDIAKMLLLSVVLSVLITFGCSYLLGPQQNISFWICLVMGFAIGGYFGYFKKGDEK